MSAFQFRKPTRRDLFQALERAVRAFVVAAVALYPIGNLEGAVFGTEAFDVDLAKKAAVAGTVAALAFLWRWLLPDVGRSTPPSPVADNPPSVAVAADEAGGSVAGDA